MQRANSNILIVIPARYASTRFPGKPLALIAGVSLIERVYRLCRRVGNVAGVVVATDDRRIQRHVRDFGGEVMLTRRNHRSGTDRVAEVARRHACGIVINVQGDEPLLDPRVITRLGEALRRQPRLSMATLCHPIRTAAEFHDPNAVKVVLDSAGDALYFSRAPIPHIGKFRISDFGFRIFQRHIGIYAYRRDFLLRYVRWPQSRLEKIERLEQLRALEHGARIRVLKTARAAIGVDVPADVVRVEQLLKRGPYGL